MGPDISAALLLLDLAAVLAASLGTLNVLRQRADFKAKAPLLLNLTAAVIAVILTSAVVRRILS